jgi:pilus assembly protein Flp/PilA
MQRTRKEEDGASAVEYGLLIALIAGVLVLVVIGLGALTTEMFADTCSGLRDGVISAGGTASGAC